MSTPAGRIWALGDYPAIARDVLAPLGPQLVMACGVGPGMRVLDVGAGTGNAAIAAALAGADVVALEPTPELIEVGREEAASRGARVEWVLGDAPPLPPGAGSPIAWGDERHLRELFGDRVADMESQVGLLRSERFADADELGRFFSASFGPAVALAATLQPAAVTALDADIRAWAGTAIRDGGLELEYVLTVARRAA